MLAANRSQSGAVGMLLRLSLVLAGCLVVSGFKARKALLVSGIRWELMMMEDSVVQQNTAGNRPYIYLADTSAAFAGLGVCNRITGHYKLAPGRQIQFTQVQATWKACRNPAFESRFMSCLRQADHYRIAGNRLLLYRGKQLLLRFRSV